MVVVRSKQEPTAPAAEYCNVLALQCGLDPAGHADSFDDLLLLETPLPWKGDLYQVAGALPQQCIDLYTLWLQRWQAGRPYNQRALLIAPDPHYSQPGYRRVLFFARPQGAFAHFARSEYLVPEPLAGALAWSLFEARDQLSAFDRYRLPPPMHGRPGVRDILVCTHGTVDVACAKFGYPLYRSLRDQVGSDTVHVWRASHFGGHVFAPTLIDLPSGHYWAYVSESVGRQIVGRSGDVGALRGHLRGWAGFSDSFAQAADCALWQQVGWDWFDNARQCEITVRDPSAPAAQSADVRIDSTPTDGATETHTTETYTVAVHITHSVDTRHSSADAATHAYPQYMAAVVENVAR